LQHRDDDEVDEFDDGHASEVSSNEDIYYQTVAVGGRRGKLDCAGVARQMAPNVGPLQ